MLAEGTNQVKCTVFSVRNDTFKWSYEKVQDCWPSMNGRATGGLSRAMLLLCIKH